MSRDDLAVQLRLEQRLVHVVGWLADAGVEALVLKGAALAHLDFAETADRTYGDVDLLVRELGPACDVLAARGYVRRQEPLMSAADRVLTKSATMVAPDGIEIDVHRTLADGTWGVTLDIDALWERATTFTLAGVPLRALDREDRLLHACVHAALAVHPRRRHVEDVAVTMAHPDVRHDVVADRARAWGCEPVVALAIARLQDRLDTVPDVPTVRTFRDHTATPVQARALAAYTDPAAGHLEKVLATVPFARSWRERVLLVVTALVPTPAYLRRTGGVRAWFARAVGALRRTVEGWRGRER